MDVKTAFQELALAVKRLLNDRINKYGINPKTGTNTLQGSELEKSINVNVVEDGIALQIADYWEFVSRGWKRTGRYPGTMSKFVNNVDNWVKRKGIKFGDMSQASMVFIIIRNIIENGIKARPFMVYDDDGDLTKMIPELNDYIDKWFDTLFDGIMEDIDNYFNK
ncbi:MAG: hypothetical protein J6T10_19030 [Methanobrevibacter sp.]|nr:hypothetical protein [Methanobrevibacter sp.]